MSNRLGYPSFHGWCELVALLREEKIVNKKINEEFSLKSATLYGGHSLFSDYLASNGLDRLVEKNWVV